MCSLWYQTLYGALKRRGFHRDTVTAYWEYKSKTLSMLRKWLRKPAAMCGLKEMAKQELKDAKAEKKRAEENWRSLLSSKDPNDDKNIIWKLWSSRRRRSPIVCWRPFTNVPVIRGKSRLAFWSHGFLQWCWWDQRSRSHGFWSIGLFKTQVWICAHRCNGFLWQSWQCVHTSSATVLVMPEIEEVE